MRHYGVSVEKVEQALKAMEYPGVASVQIIFNMVRQRPVDRFLGEALAADVGVLARVPLASRPADRQVRPRLDLRRDDHRNYNRHGAAFDVGETFAGLDYEAGLEFVAASGELVPEVGTHRPAGPSLDPHARGRHGGHPRRQDARAGPRQRGRGRPGPLAAEVMARVRELYDRYAKDWCTSAGRLPEPDHRSSLGVCHARRCRPPRPTRPSEGERPRWLPTPRPWPSLTRHCSCHTGARWRSSSPSCWSSSCPPSTRPSWAWRCRASWASWAAPTSCTRGPSPATC